MLDLDKISPQLFSMTQGYVMTLIQVHTSKVPPRSRLKCTHIKIHVRVITLHCYVGSRCFTQLLPMTQECVMILSKGHTSRSRSQCTHAQNPCPAHNSLLPCWIWIIFNSIVVHDQRVCRDIHLMSYLQGQSHSALIPKICVRAITPHCHFGSG